MTTLYLSKDQDDGLTQWCIDKLAGLHGDAYKEIEKDIAFQLLRKLRPNHVFSQVNSWTD